MTTSHDIIQASIASHNAAAERATRDLEPWAWLAAAVAMVAFGAAAVLWWATPCDAGHQCAGLLLAPAHAVRNALRGTWLHRAWVWPRAAYLRMRIHGAQADVDELEFLLQTDTQLDPADRRAVRLHIQRHRLWIAERQIKLIDCDLATRRASPRSRLQ